MFCRWLLVKNENDELAAQRVDMCCKQAEGGVSFNARRVQNEASGWRRSSKSVVLILKEGLARWRTNGSWHLETEQSEGQ